MTIIAERLAQLPAITLDHGSHDSFEEGHCAMEIVSWLAGEGFTDAPECASPVLTAFTVSVNDNWDEVQRQKLVPYLPRMVGTRGDGCDEARSYMALDWLIRTYTPAWLEVAGLGGEAQSLRGLDRIVDMASVEAAGPLVRSTRAAARVAAGAARVAARDAAWDAAWAAARDAAWAAAWAAARVAAGAAWDAAWAAAGAAGVAARVAAGAARVAARDAAWDAAWAAARFAAWAAARDALKPTVETLQTSALDLLDRMISPPVLPDMGHRP